MSKQFSIAARDHGAGIPQERFHGMAGRGRLPFITAELADTEENLGDFLLGRAVAVTVECLQHAARPRSLLPGQSGICWNGTPVKRREKAADGLDAIKAIDAEWNERGNRRSADIDAVSQHLNMLSVAKVVEEVDALLSVTWIGALNDGLFAGVCHQQRGRARKYDDARILLRKPEYGSGGRSNQRIDREIATPNAAGSCPSAFAGRRRHVQAPQNRGRKRRFGGAIPRPDRMRSSPRHDRIPPRNATLTHLVSSRSSPSSVRFAGGQNSRMSCFLEVIMLAKGDALTASPLSRTLIFPHQFAIAVFGHPAGAREMAIVHVAALCGIEIGVEAEQNLERLTPVRTVARGIEQPQIEDHMVPVIVGECFARRRLG